MWVNRKAISNSSASATCWPHRWSYHESIWKWMDTISSDNLHISLMISQMACSFSKCDKGFVNADSPGIVAVLSAPHIQLWCWKGLQSPPGSRTPNTSLLLQPQSLQLKIRFMLLAVSAIPLQRYSAQLIDNQSLGHRSHGGQRVR